MVVYGQSRAGQQWPIVGCKGGSWVVLGGKVLERAYVGPLAALSWRISVGSRLAKLYLIAPIGQLDVRNINMNLEINIF